MERIFTTFKLPVRYFDRYVDVVEYRLPYLVIPTPDWGRIFFTHSLEDGSPDARVLRVFAAKLRRKEVDRLVVCYPDRLAQSSWRWVLRYHLLPFGRGVVATHDNEEAAAQGVDTSVRGGHFKVMISVVKK